MASRITPIIEEISGQVEGMRTHLPTLEKVVEEADLDQAKESLEHLRVCIMSLDQVLQNEGLRALPVLELTEVQKVATKVGAALPEMAQDASAHQANFTNRVDALYRKLWVGGFIDPRVTTTAFNEAVGGLSAAMETARAHVDELKEGLRVRDQVLEAADEVDKLKATTTGDATEVHKVLSTVQAHEKEALSAEESAATHATNVEQLLNSANDREARLRSIEAELVTWHDEINAKRTEIEELRTEVEQLRDSTSTRLETHDEDISGRQKELEGITKRIEEQFRLASSGALAKAFGERGALLLWGKVGWGFLALASYGGAVGFAWWLANTAIPERAADGTMPPLDWPYFAVRLAVGIPIAFLVWFATVQFSKARRVQEAYAFKGTVASSFDAYRDLVEAITKDPELKERPEFAQFITRTIRDLYTPPQSEKEDEDNPPHTKALKEVSVLVKEIGNLASKIR